MDEAFGCGCGGQGVFISEARRLTSRTPGLCSGEIEYEQLINWNINKMNIYGVNI